MKRYFVFIIILVCSITNAQTINDVLRFSTKNLQGTARYQGMGGAFGALGGDLSALNENPAGASVFNNNLASISGTLYSLDNTATGTGGIITGTNSNNGDINQVGAVLIFKTTNPESKWIKLGVAINYDLEENYNNQINVRNTGVQGVDTYFLDFAQGVPFGDIRIQDGEFIEEAYRDIGSSLGFEDQQAFLGVVGGLISPTSNDDATSTYSSNASYTNLNTNLDRFVRGYNSKLGISVAGQYEDVLHLGASVNLHNIVYDRYDEYTETNYDADSEIQRTTFDNRLISQGAGISLSLGAIAKLSNMIRIGGSYQSPTWYQIEDQLSQSISSDLADENINFINHDFATIFPVYNLKTPAKLTASAALVFGKQGLLSIDYGYQDFSTAKLGPEDDGSFQNLNNNISNDLGVVNSIRLGGEYRINNVSLRAGYRFESSPYNNVDTYGDVQGLSGGIGYNFGSSRLDFAINSLQRDIEEPILDSGFTGSALVNAITTNATLTYTLNF